MKKLNVLIVEDESLTALELASSITNHGHNVVDYVTTPKQAVDTINKNRIDLIIMDINLQSHINGIELYKSLHKKINIIYLTAYKDDKTISQAIETEPLGYLIKPHNDSELSALLKLAELKVSQVQQQINLGHDYLFDTVEKKLFHNHTFVKLSKKELSLLILLIEARGNIVTFQTIEYELWETPPNASTLRTLIYRLRNKLNHKLITTENSYGIKINVL